MVPGTSSGKWIRMNGRSQALEGYNLGQTNVIHLRAWLSAQRRLAQDRHLFVAASSWSQALASDTILGPGISLCTFSCPCSPSVAWRGSHHASSPWLMGHFVMTQPPQANSVPPADRSPRAATAQEARTLSSSAGTAKCVVWALVSGEPP